MTDLAAGHPRTDAVDSVSTRTHGEPFAVVGPWKDDPAAAGQVVFTTVHSGHDLRPEVAERMILPEDDRFREEDPFTDAIARGVGSGIVMHRARFEVDLNRPRATAVYMEPGQCWGLDVRRGGRLDEDVAERSRQVHDAWYAELGRRLDVLAARGPYAVFDVHSFNHRRDGADAGPAPQEQNPDVNVGTGSLDREPWIPVVDAFMDSMARPLQVDGEYAAFRRRSTSDDVRSNMSAGGKAEKVKVTDEMLELVEAVRPKLLADGMFLVGLDIVGDKLMEVNVLSPGGLGSCQSLYGVDFAPAIIEDLERKVSVRKHYKGQIGNANLATI